MATTLSTANLTIRAFLSMQFSPAMVGVDFDNGFTASVNDQGMVTLWSDQQERIVARALDSNAVILENEQGDWSGEDVGMFHTMARTQAGSLKLPMACRFHYRRPGLWER